MKQRSFVRKAKKTFILDSIAELFLGIVQTPLMDLFVKKKRKKKFKAKAANYFHIKSSRLTVS